MEELGIVKDYINEGDWIKLYSGKAQGTWEVEIWPNLKETLYANKVRGISTPQVYAWEKEEGFTVGNVQFNVTYA